MLAARSSADVLDLKQRTGLLNKIVSRAVDLVTGDIEPPHHHARAARPMLDFPESVGIGQATIEGMRNRFLPDADSFAPVACLDLRRRILEHAKEVDPTLAIRKPPTKAALMLG